MSSLLQGVKTKEEFRKPEALKPNPLNARSEADMDIPSMINDIKLLGRVVEPLHIKNDGTLLKGHRRLAGVMALLNDGNTPQELVEALQKLRVIVYPELSQEQEVNLVLDQNSQRGLGKFGVAKAIRTLRQSGYDDKRLLELTWDMAGKVYAPSNYSKKKAEIEATLSYDDRMKIIMSWLRGTVVQLILDGYALTPDVVVHFENEIHRRDGRPVPPNHLKIWREEVNKLRAAKNIDKAKDQWDDAKGGPAYQAAWDKIVKEATGGRPQSDKRPSTTQLKGIEDVYQSKLAKGILKYAQTGEQMDGLGKVDEDFVRFFGKPGSHNGVIGACLDYTDKVKKDATVNLYEVLGLVIHGDHKKWTEFLAKYV